MTIHQWWQQLGRAVRDAGSVPIEWTDLVCQQVGPLCADRWKAMPIHRWQTRFPGINAVLVYSAVQAGAGIELLVYGLVKLMQRTSSTPVSQQLIQRNWLSPSELLCQSDSRLASVFMLYPTLETAHRARIGDGLDMIHLNPEADEALISQAIMMMAAFARCGSTGEGEALMSNTFKYSRDALCSADVQINMAKMRFYMKLALAGMSQGTNAARVSDDEIVARGIDALRLWTLVLVNMLCPSEQHVEDAIVRFGLPLTLRVTDPTSWMLSPMAPVTASDPRLLTSADDALPLYMQIGVHENTRVMSRLYSSASQAGNVNAQDMLDRETASGVLLESYSVAPVVLFTQRGVRYVSWSRPPSVANERAVFDPELPVSLFMRLSLNLYGGCEQDDGEQAPLDAAVQELRECLLRWLVSYLAFNTIEVTANTRLSVCCEYEQHSGTLFFGVQELVFKAGASQMHEFVLAWMQRYRLASVLLPPAAPYITHFIAHMHPDSFSCFDANKIGEPASQLVPSFVRAASKRSLMRGIAHSISVVPGEGMGEPFSCRAFGHWLAGRVVVDLELVRLSICSDHGGDLKRYAKRVLGSPMDDICGHLCRIAVPSLSLRLQDLVVRAACNHKPGGRNTAELVFQSAEYQELQTQIGAGGDMLADFFRHLFAGSTIYESNQGAKIRADGKIMMTLTGQYRMSWCDFSLNAKSFGLGPLVRHRMASLTPLEAVDYIKRWVSTYRPASPGAGTIERRQPKKVDLEEVRADNIRKLRHYNSVSPGTSPNHYLRTTRGLEDADFDLIENNPVLKSGTRDNYPMPSTTPGGPPNYTPFPTLVVHTERFSAIQLTFIDPKTFKKVCLPQGYSAKRNSGSISVEGGRCDAVLLRQGSYRQPDLVIVAEGMETAASVANALRRAAVYFTMGISNIPNFSVASASTVLVCMENDKQDIGSAANEPPPPPTAEQLRKQAAKKHLIDNMLRKLRLSFKRVLPIWPPKQYDDFNAIHQAHPGAVGSEMVRQVFRNAMSIADMLSEYERLVVVASADDTGATAVVASSSSSSSSYQTNKRPR